MNSWGCLRIANPRTTQQNVTSLPDDVTKSITRRRLQNLRFHSVRPSTRCTAAASTQKAVPRSPLQPVQVVPCPSLRSHSTLLRLLRKLGDASFLPTCPFSRRLLRLRAGIASSELLEEKELEEEVLAGGMALTVFRLSAEAKSLVSQLTSTRDKTSFHQNCKVLVGSRFFVQHTLLQPLASLSPMSIFALQHINKGLLFAFDRGQGFFCIGHSRRLHRRERISIIHGSRASRHHFSRRYGGCNLVQQVCAASQEKVVRESPAADASVHRLRLWRRRTVSNLRGCHGRPSPFL